MAVGCALAVAAASTGGFLEADQQAPPFGGLRTRRVVEVTLSPSPRPVRTGGTGGGGGGEVGRRIADAVDTSFRALGAVLAALVLLWGLYLLIRALVRLARVRAARGTVTPPTRDYDPGEESTEDAETALRRRVADELGLLSADLDSYADPREAVIACYVRMEAALADAGTPRAPTETPLELLARVLESYDVPEPDVRRLTDLFTEARFSPHPVTEDMRAAARRSLAAVADALAVRA
jgi:hypothetical protein